MTFRKIMLIDDDPDDQWLFALALDKAAHVQLHDTACDGVEALQKLTAMTEHPELIFLDLNMPLMDGAALLQKIKADPALDQIPVVIYSTSDYVHTIEEVRALGAYKFFHKPIKFESLQGLLAQILDGSYTDFVVK